ncbi:MAG: LuxR C-terminal-related transcriptional regulator, partial [Pseudomonadota bacterium]|nr:LuxR C-terminal-related transcriptional regulator [Pseudomonadota bacterium]
ATGWRREEVIDREEADLELWGSGPERDKIVQKLRESGHVRSIDVQARAKDGAVTDFLLSAETVEIDGAACVLSLMLDITERKQTETELLSAVQSVMQDTTWLGQRIVERMATLNRGGRAATKAPEVASLPARVREVLSLIAQGLSDDDIAGQLGISKNTVRNHVSVIYNRLEIRKRSAVIVWARERGLGATAKPRRTSAKKRPRLKL